MNNENITHNFIVDLVDQLFDDGHQIKFRMKGNSMFPVMRCGDIGLVERCNPDDLKVGDIIVFKTPNKMIGHRLEKIIEQNDERIFIARGDNCYRSDAPFKSDALIGKTVSYQRGSRSGNPYDRISSVMYFFVKHLPHIVLLINRVYLKGKRIIGNI